MKIQKKNFFVCLILLAIILVTSCNGQNQNYTETEADRTLSAISPATISPTNIPAVVTPTPVPTRVIGELLPVRCLYVSFDKRGYPSGYYSGEIISEFNDLDPIVGHTVKEEVSLQLDEIAKLGVNSIAFELRSSDPVYLAGPFSPPSCNITPALGLQYPQPDEKEITNLVDFLDLLESKGMKVYLRLVNTHMEEQPPTGNTLWLNTILSAIKNHPALALVLFEGNTHTIDTNGDGVGDLCGIPAEPPLWDGPNSVPAKYIKWAIAYAHSLGVPYQKLSAEAVIGDFSATQPEVSGYANTVQTLKEIFDAVGVPEEQRTYALSLYERPKCAYSRIPCEEEQPHLWAIKTFDYLFQTLGKDTKANIILVEMGLSTNMVQSGNNTYNYEPIYYDHWNKSMALESLVWLMQKYDIDGGCFWAWVNTSSVEEQNPVYGEQIKQRGSEFSYNPIKDVLQNLYTYGETEEIGSTPDESPPIFHSIKIEPEGIENGQAFTISVDMGEPYLFVLADISEVDDSQTDPLVLINDGENNYSVTTTIHWWNEVQNGKKSIKLWAMDFWGNVSETTVEVNLDNPAPILDAIPPNDTFDGNSLAPSRWYAELNGGNISIDDQLILSVPNDPGPIGSKVVSRWSFNGDFDVQVDFKLGTGWSAPSKEHLDGASLGLQINGMVYHITRLRSQNEDTFFTWCNQDDQTSKTYTSVTEGKFRLIRKTDRLYLLFDDGSGWRVLEQRRISTQPAQIYLAMGSVNAEQSFETYFDNFLIHSGATNYQP